MATVKITITLEQDQVRQIQELVAAGRSANVSAFVKHAVKVALADAAGWREMLQEALRRTGGPPTKEERAWVNSIHILRAESALVRGAPREWPHVRCRWTHRARPQ